MTINEWAQRWGIPPAAIADLTSVLTDQPAPLNGRLSTESGAQQAILLEASKQGRRLWRNNVGACQDANGRFIRYGLANNSSKLNAHIKSADLIGVTPRTVEPEHVGQRWGIFTSVEVKKPGWRYTGTEREAAQLKWAEIVGSLGGIAMFATGPEGLR